MPGSEPVFVDTSAVYAVLVADDRNHGAAARAVARLHEEQAPLVTSSFVVQESVSLLQARAGVTAVRLFHDAVLPALTVVWIDVSLYRPAAASLLAAGKRSVSITDWTSFEIMRERSIARAFAFDRDFATQGFLLVPGRSSMGGRGA
jgi:predicted nucleic acid-binding protein